MNAKNNQVFYAEDEFGKKLDRCITDSIVKSSGGLVLGSVISLLFFKRKAWPIILGTGFGTGVAYRTCEKDLNM
ncbi:MICOS complex subunit MIC10-like [Lucilia cuprina]|uniref:MICOS complex subunit MIC10-like n=1 Tax=Lucilia cuprina TaxID=7375 RepID=UPI001F057698|nr:MICOS complex subunit MIC10-like [Lucilia cuprina]